MVKNKLAVLLLNYNSWKETLDIAKKIVNDFSIVYKDIIIVDNCSSNDSREKLQQNSNLGYVYIESDKNGGYAYGNNIGLRYVKENKYDYVWIINNDIIIEDKEFVKKILNVFNMNNDIAVVNSDIYSPDNHLYNRDSVRPSFFDYTLGLLNYKNKGRSIKDLGGYAYIYRPQGCCMIVETNKIDEINYLDENTFLYHEENILAERLLKKDYKCCVCTNTSVIHNHSKTVKNNINKLNYIKINNQSFSYYLREYRGFNELKIAICKLFNALKLLLLD